MFKIQNLSTMSVARKLGVLTICAVLGIVALTAIFMISERTLVLEERKSSIQQAVETTHSLVIHYHDLATKGVLTEEKAKQQAMQAVKRLRYNDTDYFWINDMQPRMLMHPTNPALDGQDLRGNKDPNGLHLFVEMVGAVKVAGSGFVPYMWPKPGSDKPVQKMSYVKGFAPWGWVIGSGVYIDTVDSTILSRLIDFSIGALILAVMLFGIGIFISRSVLNQLGGEPDYASDITRRIAHGDLTVPIDLKNNDQSSLLYAIKEMRDSIANIVVQVRTSTDTIATASSQIASGNMDLSSRTEEQASSLEQTASSMEELTSTVRQNAANAQRANQLAIVASDVAVKGGAVVSQVVQTMSEINASSKKMSDIIGVIDSIAFQTNILALNAAVEAARAGEQGRGFAVVATEVRNLAQRSAAAAREIKSLIDNSVDKVGEGSKLVGHAGATMDEVVASIKRVYDIMGEITSASREQSEGIEQVNQAIMQMDTVTQQNAALVEEAAAAAESLQDQAANLVQVVSVFNTGHGSPGDARPAQKAAVITKERRGPNRATNVTRIPLPAPKSSNNKAPSQQIANATPITQAQAEKGDDWEQF